MFIEIKIAQWKRIKIPNELENEFKTRVLNQEITKTIKAIRFLNDNVEIVHEKMLETVEYIAPEDNHGEATFQVFDDNHNLVYSNDILPVDEDHIEPATE
jgi:hypothetical protein